MHTPAVLRAWVEWIIKLQPQRGRQIECFAAPEIPGPLFFVYGIINP
jgi:hypothetical protein